MMKKLIIAAALILFAGVAFGQTLQKGSVLALRVTTITLKPEVTMNQYLDFLINKVGPEFEKYFTGMKVFFLKGGSGENTNEYAYLIYFETVKARDKYFSEVGNITEEGLAAMEKVFPAIEPLGELGTETQETSGWVIL